MWVRLPPRAPVLFKNAGSSVCPEDQGKQSTWLALTVTNFLRGLRKSQRSERVELNDLSLFVGEHDHSVSRLRDPRADAQLCLVPIRFFHDRFSSSARSRFHGVPALLS